MQSRQKLGIPLPEKVKMNRNVYNEYIDTKGWG